MSITSQTVQEFRNRLVRLSGGRPITLVAVSKTQSAERLREAFQAGLQAFGENYLQEALAKQQALADLAIEWHFIGPLQSNKTRPVAEHFTWVHSVDRLKLAQRLSDQRPPGMAPLQLCVQVNVSGEASKSGVAPAELPALAHAVAALPGVRLRGLMAVPEATPELDLLRRRFRQLRELRDSLVAAGLPLDTLSMGMSADYPLAIEEGATLVRVGSLLFGARSPRTAA